MWVENLNTEIILPKEQVDNVKLDIDWVKAQIETQVKTKALRDEILNDTDRKLTHEQIVVALSQYENQPWPQVIDDNSAAYVISLQLALKAAGHDVGKIDALYGTTTKAAVETFQREQGLTVDGWAGPYTMQKLIAKLGWTPKTITPNTRSTSVPNGTGTGATWNETTTAETGKPATEVVAEKPKDLVEALKKRPLTAFDKKWLKENLGVEDITKIPAWKDGCNGVAYYIGDKGISIVMQKWWLNNWKWWMRWNDWDKYAWDFKNDHLHWKWTYYYADWKVSVLSYKNEIGTETFVNPKNTKQVLYTVQWSNNEVVTDKNGNEVRNITDITQLPKWYTWSDAAIYQVKNVLTGQRVTFYGNGRCYVEPTKKTINTQQYINSLVLWGQFWGINNWGVNLLQPPIIPAVPETTVSTPETANEKTKDIIEALKKQPLTSFDKKWLKDNLGVEDVTKLSPWKPGCDGLAYHIINNSLENAIVIALYKNGKKEWKWWVRWNDDWTKYAWDFKNDYRAWKGAYMYENWEKYIWDWKEGERDWEWKYYYWNWQITVWKYKKDVVVKGTENIIKAADSIEDRLEWKNIAFDKIFTKEDLKDPIRIKQIETFKKYFDKNGIKLDDVEEFVQNNKKMIRFDLDNNGVDKNWTQNLTCSYDVVFNKYWSFNITTFSPKLRDYIINKLFNSDKLTDIFTKIKDKNTKKK